MATVPKPEVHLFADTGEIPNNRTLPLVIYKAALPAGTPDLAEKWEALYGENGWKAAWRFGVYPFAHYHSTAHEVLGIFQGHANLRLGHTQGITAHVEAGDVIIIPAGVGHQNLGSSTDFQAVGGYPKGQEWDLLRGEEGERPGADENIARVPLPSTDPIFGSAGALRKLWNIS